MSKATPNTAPEKQQGSHMAGGFSRWQVKGIEAFHPKSNNSNTASIPASGRKINHTSLHLSHKKNSVGISSQPPHLLHATQVLSSELDAVHQSVPNSGTQLCYGTALLWVFPKMHSTIYKVYIFCTIQKHVLRPVAPTTRGFFSSWKPAPHLERWATAEGLCIQEVHGWCWNKLGTMKVGARPTPKIVYAHDRKGPLADTTSCYIWGSRELLDKTFLNLPKKQSKIEIKMCTAGKMNLGLGIWGIWDVL